MSWYSAFEELLPTAAVALIFGVIKAILAPIPRTLSQSLVIIAVAVPVGTLMGLLARESGLQPYAAYTICSMCSLLSQDLVLGIMKNKTFLGDLLKRALENIVDKGTK